MTRRVKNCSSSLSSQTICWVSVKMANSIWIEEVVMVIIHYCHMTEIMNMVIYLKGQLVLKDDLYRKMIDLRVIFQNSIASVLLFYFFFFQCFLFHFIFWQHHTAYEMLVPQPGIETGSTAVKTPSPNHWPTKEFSLVCSETM